MSLEEINFGDIWIAKIPGFELGPYMIVSSPHYHASLNRVIGCQVVLRPARRGEIAVEVPDYGTALLDRIQWIWRSFLVEQPPLQPALPPARYTHVARVIANLLGP